LFFVEPIVAVDGTMHDIGFTIQVSIWSLAEITILVRDDAYTGDDTKCIATLILVTVISSRLREFSTLRAMLIINSTTGEPIKRFSPVGERAISSPAPNPLVGEGDIEPKHVSELHHTLVPSDGLEPSLFQIRNLVVYPVDRRRQSLSIWCPRLDSNQ
jgi:hypothetical protein